MANKIFGIFGVGAFGAEICRVMTQNGANVVVFDNDPKVINNIKDSVMQAILVDCQDENELRDTPIDTIDTAIVAIGSNQQSSILTCAILKKLDVPYIIARAVSDIHAQILTQLGVNEVINIEVDGGRRLANKLISPNVLDVIPLSKNLIIAEVLMPKPFIGKTLLQLDLRNKFRVNVISIKKTTMAIDDFGNPDKSIVVSFPNPNDILDSTDTLYILGTEKDINSIKEL